MPAGVWPTQTVEDSTFRPSLAALACTDSCFHAAISYVSVFH